MHLITIFLRARIIQVSKERRNIALVCPDTHMTKFTAALFSASLNMFNLHWALRTQEWWLLNNHSSTPTLILPIRINICNLW